MSEKKFDIYTCENRLLYGMTPIMTYRRHHKRWPQPTEGEPAGTVTEREDEPIPRNG